MQNISRIYERFERILIVLIEIFEGGTWPKNNRLDFDGDLDLLPLFCPNFAHPKCIFSEIAIVYYYSLGGSTSRGGAVRSTDFSPVIYYC